MRAYFRPYVKELHSETSTTIKTHSNEPGCFVGNTGGDDNWNTVVGTSDDCSQTFLFIHQEEWQGDLMAKYGNTISLLKATYKTTLYDLLLFFVCVKTNVGYIVVAEFVIQSEAGHYIAEALAKLKEWNPTWKPHFFMTDYSEAEYLAIEQEFPQCTVYLCDFHREQAWERWVKDRNHGLTIDEGQKLLDLLRDCAHAPSPAHTDPSPLEAYYHQAIQRLQEAEVWNKHESVRKWLESKWLNIPEVHVNTLYRLFWFFKLYTY